MDEMEQTVIPIFNYPTIRIEVKDAFAELANLNNKQKRWPYNKSGDINFWYGLKYNVLDMLYSECDLDEYNKYNIGKIFYNEEEAKEIWKFCNWFRCLIDNIGGEKIDSAYLKHPEWPKVYIGAKGCFMLMDVNDRQFNFDEEYNLYLKNKFPNHYK